MPVEAVVRGVDLAPEKPLGERLVPLQNLVPRLEPSEQLGLLTPESFGVVPGLVPEGLVLLQATDVGRLGELRRGRKDPCLLENTVDRSAALRSHVRTLPGLEQKGFRVQVEWITPAGFANTAPGCVWTLGGHGHGVDRDWILRRARRGVNHREAGHRTPWGLLVFAEAAPRILLGLTVAGTERSVLNPAWSRRRSKAAVEVVKLDFLLTSVGLLTRPEVCSGTADPSTSPSRRGSARNASSDRVPRDRCGSRACCKCAAYLGSAARSRR